MSASLRADAQNQLAAARPVIGIDAIHVLRERDGMHRDFGMIVRAEGRRALDANGPVA